MKLLVCIEIEVNEKINELSVDINTEYDELVLFSKDFKYDNESPYLSNNKVFKSAKVKGLIYSD